METPSSFTRELKPNEIIFAEGDSADCAYLVEEGRVAILTMAEGHEVVVATFGAGEIFGEMAIIDGLQRSATAKAIDKCRLTVIYREQLFEHINKSNPIIRLLVSILIKRMRESNNRLHKTKSSLLASGEVEKPGTFEVDENNAPETIERIRMESELKDALTRQEFILEYQPIVHMDTKKIAGFEALIRWESKTRGLVSPGYFMQIIEETSLILPVGHWIQERAFEDFKLLQKKLGPDIFMSINISARQLENTKFLDDLEDVRKKSGIPAKNIKLEMTERLLLEGSLAAEILNDTAKKGYLISIDDFGTGYSNLLYLAKFNFNSLKIDRSFVRALLKDEKIAVLFRGIVDIAAGLGLKIIAEGIETLEELESIRKYKVEYGQGYYFGRPQSVKKHLEN